MPPQPSSSSPRRAEPRPALLGRGLILVMVTLFLGALVPNLFVLASRFLHERHFDEREIGIIGGGFQLAALVATPLIGWLVGRFGHSRVIAVGCLVAAAGAIGFDLATTLPGFVAGRAAQGLGWAGIMVGAGSYVADSAPVDRLGEALGISGVLTLAAQAVGPSVGEAVHAMAGWSMVFQVGAGAGVAGALVALTLPAAHRDPLIVDRPRGDARWALTAITLTGVGFGAVWMFLADYSTQVGVTEVTWFFVPYVLAAVSTRLTMGTLSDRIGRKEAAAPMLIGHAVVLSILIVLSAPWQLVVVGLGYGFCHGVYYPAMQALVVEQAGGQRGRAVAAANFAFGTGVLIAAYGLGSVARATGYPTIYAIAAGCGLLASAVLWYRT